MAIDIFKGITDVDARYLAEKLEFEGPLLDQVRRKGCSSTSYPESSGSLASGWSPRETLGYWSNLVPRVLRLFGQRLVARRDSGLVGRNLDYKTFIF